MKMYELRNMTREELIMQKKLLIEEWFNLRMQSAIKTLDNPRRIRQIKKDIARINTILREHELGIRRIISEKPEEVSAETQKPKEPEPEKSAGETHEEPAEKDV